MRETPLIRRVTSSPKGALVNADLVETATGVVAVDSLLTVSDSRTLRRRVQALGKPLEAVLLTQSHPDHYGGSPSWSPGMTSRSSRRREYTM